MLQLYESCPKLLQRTMSALKITLSHGFSPGICFLEFHHSERASSHFQQLPPSRLGSSKAGSQARQPCPHSLAPLPAPCPPAPCPRKHLVPRDTSVLSLCPTPWATCTNQGDSKARMFSAERDVQKKTNLYILEG